MASTEHPKQSRAVVCHITTVHLPFDVRIFQKECISLVRAGYEVHLIACHDKDETVDGVHIHGLLPPPDRLQRMFWWTWLAYREVWTISPRPWLCHFHDPELLPVGMALRLQGFRVVYDVHENVSGQILTKEYLPPALRRILSWGYRFAELILTSGMATVHVLDSIAQHYRRPQVVVRNLPILGPVPTGKSESQPSRCLVYSGVITRDRGAIVMLDAAAELKRRGVDFEMKLVGRIHEKALHKEMLDRIERDELSSCVRLIGHVAFDQAQKHIASGDLGLCLFQPIPNNLNSMPNKLREYMGAGLSVVASDFECWRHAVADAGTGLQVDPTRADQIADAVEYLLAHPQEARRMGKQGRKLVETRFNWEREKDKLLEFYRRLIRRPGNENSRCQSV